MFIGDTNFINLFIIALITGSILSLDRSILLRSFAGYIPAILGGVAAAMLLGVIGGLIFGVDPGRSVTYYVLPIMGGGNGGGAVPLSQMYEGVIAGITSFFSSGLGVVFPTLVPTAGGIAAGFDGVNAMAIISAIVIGGTVTGFSPISTTGALIMSGVESDDEYKATYTENDMFKRLWMVAFLALAVVGLFGFLGVYDFINNMFA